MGNIIFGEDLTGEDDEELEAHPKRQKREEEEEEEESIAPPRNYTRAERGMFSSSSSQPPIDARRSYLLGFLDDKDKNITRAVDRVGHDLQILMKDKTTGQITTNRETGYPFRISFSFTVNDKNGNDIRYFVVYERNLDGSPKLYQIENTRKPKPEREHSLTPVHQGDPPTRTIRVLGKVPAEVIQVVFKEIEESLLDVKGWYLNHLNN